MKDILFEEHFRLIKGNIIHRDFLDGSNDAAKASSELTRKHMRGFAEWLNPNNWDHTVAGWRYFDIDCEDGDIVWLTTEQLIDKYFESLSNAPTQS